MENKKEIITIIKETFSEGLELESLVNELESFKIIEKYEKFNNGFILKTKTFSDLFVSVEYNKLKKGFYLVFEEIEKFKEDKRFLVSYEADMFNLDEFKHYVLLKPSTRSNNKFLTQFEVILSNNIQGIFI